MLQTELAKDKIHPQASNLITRFMVLAIVLTIISLGFTLYDHAQSKAEEVAKEMTAKVSVLEGNVSNLETKLSKVWEIASGMDMGLLNKRLSDSAIAGNEDLKNVLKENIKALCNDVGRIGVIADDTTLGTKCKEKSGL